MTRDEAVAKYGEIVVKNVLDYHGDLVVEKLEETYKRVSKITITFELEGFLSNTITAKTLKDALRDTDYDKSSRNLFYYDLHIGRVILKRSLANAKITVQYTKKAES